MRYISTRGGIEPINFKESVMMGLASDGGLLLPENIPSLSDKLNDLSKLSYTDLAYEVISLYATDIPAEDLKSIINRSYSTFRDEEVTPVRDLAGLHILELFHGPTLAFKDVALQLLGNLFEYILEEQGGELNIIGATSGDTGSAAIHGVRGKDRIKIFIMHPDNRVSSVQKQQMTSVLDDNVYNLAINGTFDDCQAILKEIFADVAFKLENSLGSINSINWARVLAQVVYYFYAYFRVKESSGKDIVNFTVPTGNFGDIFAGWIAVSMGLPVKNLILASNSNDILSRFFNTGEYRSGEVCFTHSPSMDIQVASNFERYLYYLLEQDSHKLKFFMAQFSETGSIKIDYETIEKKGSIFKAGCGSNEDTLETIRSFYESSGYLLDPHTAVGVYVARQFDDGETPMICLSTAHPGKFPEAILEATGKDIATHPEIEKIKDYPTDYTVVDNDTFVVKDFVKRNI